MKKVLISFLLIFSAFTVFAQDYNKMCLGFNANIVDVSDSEEEDNILEWKDSSFGFDFSSKVFHFSTDTYEYQEVITDFEQEDGRFAVWTQSALYFLFFNSDKRLDCIMEFPYIGTVQYRKYYFVSKIPIMSRG